MVETLLWKFSDVDEHIEGAQYVIAIVSKNVKGLPDQWKECKLMDLLLDIV